MSAVRSRISSKLILARCVGYFDRAYYGYIYQAPVTVAMVLYTPSTVYSSINRLPRVK